MEILRREQVKSKWIKDRPLYFCRRLVCLYIVYCKIHLVVRFLHQLSSIIYGYCRIKLRDSLQKQIEIKEGQKEHFYANTEESERLGNEAKEYNQRKKEENDKKKQYYSTFRDFNKMVTAHFQ